MNPRVFSMVESRVLKFYKKGKHKTLNISIHQIIDGKNIEPKYTEIHSHVQIITTFSYFFAYDDRFYYNIT